MGFVREVIDAFRGVEKLAVTDRRLGGGESPGEERRTVERRKRVDPQQPADLPEGVVADRRKAAPVFGKAERRKTD